MTPEELLDAIQTCWCAILADSAGGAPEACCVTAGAPSVAACCGGFAWVRLVSAYPSVGFPTPMNKPQNCIIDTWALKVEVGILRCAPEPCDVLSNTCCTSEEEAAVIMLDDFRQMRKLWTCGCIGLSQSEIIMGDLRAFGPQGGCVGVIMNATIRASD